ncbi:nucleoside triphosphate pyrophosphohydrolase [Methylobacterium haplocladii]|nr:nucleoside triphosphate pyrophosphohydrolase [Methylobacterium haplocladii]
MTNHPIDTLLHLMAMLRDPVRGCSWDVAQTPASIVPFTIEEAYEVADAVDRGDPDELRDELGDLLLQVVFQARMAEEAARFDFTDVVGGIVAKLIRRHPHVFEVDGTLLPIGRPRDDPATVEAAWARIKSEERAEAAARGRVQPTDMPLDGIPLAIPALTRAEKISRKAAGYGFDWPNAREVIAKVREETDEVEESLGAGDPAAIAEEIGDLLFSVANLARHAGIDAEEALRQGTRKFERRFTAMAARLEADGRTLASSDLPAMEAAWQAVKRGEG